MDKQELLDRLKNLDRDATLTFSESSKFKCYIVGGSALILMGYSIRATHDIDILEKYPKDISRLFDKYDMNSTVVAYYDCFPSAFEDRAIKLDIDTEMVEFYTLSIEDLVISKLCTTRGEQDVTDINSDVIIKSINWDVLETLANRLISEKFSGIDNFKYNYNDYVRRNKPWEILQLKDILRDKL